MDRERERERNKERERENDVVVADVVVAADDDDAATTDDATNVADVVLTFDAAPIVVNVAAISDVVATTYTILVVPSPKPRE